MPPCDDTSAEPEEAAGEPAEAEPVSDVQVGPTDSCVGSGGACVGTHPGERASSLLPFSRRCGVFVDWSLAWARHRPNNKKNAGKDAEDETKGDGG